MLKIPARVKGFYSLDYIVSFYLVMLNTTVFFNLDEKQIYNLHAPRSKKTKQNKKDIWPLDGLKTNIFAI